MTSHTTVHKVVALPMIFAAFTIIFGSFQKKDVSGDSSRSFFEAIPVETDPLTIHQSVRNDISRSLASVKRSPAESLAEQKSFSPSGIPSQALAANPNEASEQGINARSLSNSTPIAAAGAAVEQKSQGSRPPAAIVASFESRSAAAAAFMRLARRVIRPAVLRLGRMAT
jgi:hypothetical protein